MNLDRFVSERSRLWTELDEVTQAARGKPERLPPGTILRLGDLYRAAAADLAYARRKWPRDPVVTRLDHLVGRARVIVYDTPPARRGVRAFFATEYWARICERPLALLLAAAILFVPLVLTAFWAAQDRGAAMNFIPEEFAAVVEPKESGEGLGLSTGQEAQFSSYIFTNNIRVTFMAFAAGILVAVGTALLVGYNGVFIGAVTGLAFQAGNGLPFTELVIAHGVLELSCIVVTGAAGLRLGWAIVAPGHRGRGEATVEEAKRGVEIVLGTMPWLVLAGLVEGFVTPGGYGFAFNATVGVLLGALYWGLALTRGRGAASEADTRLRA